MKERRWDFKVACGGLRIFLWQKVVDKELLDKEI